MKHYEVPKFIHKIKKENYYLFDESSIKFDFENEYKNQLYNQISLLRIESYFNYIIRLIFQEDYLKKGLMIDKPSLLNLYYQTSTKILKDNASIILDNSISPYEEIQTSFEWKEHHLYYGKELELIVKTILNIINYNKELQQILDISENENLYFSAKAHQFVQCLIMVAYSQATQRIEDEINNENFLGVELLKNNTNEELIVYLTPQGMMEAPEFFTNIDNERKIAEWNKIFNQVGIQRLDLEELKKQHNSSVILAHNNKLYCHYKQFDLSYNDFINKRINRPHLSSILMESQANYKKIE